MVRPICATSRLWVRRTRKWSPSGATKTWVLCRRRRNGIEWMIRSRSRWKASRGPRSVRSSSACRRPRLRLGSAARCASGRGGTLLAGTGAGSTRGLPSLRLGSAGGGAGGIAGLHPLYFLARLACPGKCRETGAAELGDEGLRLRRACRTVRPAAATKSARTAPYRPCGCAAPPAPESRSRANSRASAARSLTVASCTQRRGGLRRGGTPCRAFGRRSGQARVGLAAPRRRAMLRSPRPDRPAERFRPALAAALRSPARAPVRELRPRPRVGRRPAPG